MYSAQLLFSHSVMSNSFVTPWTAAHQSPLYVEFSKQEYWSGLPFPPPGDFPNPGIEPVSPASPALAGRLFIIIWDALKSTYSVKTNKKLASRNKSNFQLKNIREIIVYVCVFNTRVFHTAGRCFTTWADREAQIKAAAAAAAKSLQSCLTLHNPVDGSPQGSPVPGILQARTLELGAISISNAWKGKGKVKSLSRGQLFVTPWTVVYHAPPYMGFSRQEYWSGFPYPSPRDLPDPGIEPGSPALQAESLPFELPGKHLKMVMHAFNQKLKKNFFLMRNAINVVLPELFYFHKHAYSCIHV